jgi:hypothetical protein
VGAPAGSFADLEGGAAEDFLAVSCGLSGYVPELDEWAKQRDYFTP